VSKSNDIFKYQYIFNQYIGVSCNSIRFDKISIFYALPHVPTM